MTPTRVDLSRKRLICQHWKSRLRWNAEQESSRFSRHSRIHAKFLPAHWTKLQIWCLRKAHVGKITTIYDFSSYKNWNFRNLKRRRHSWAHMADRTHKPWLMFYLFSLIAPAAGYILLRLGGSAKEGEKSILVCTCLKIRPNMLCDTENGLTSQKRRFLFIKTGIDLIFNAKMYISWKTKFAEAKQDLSSKCGILLRLEPQLQDDALEFHFF